MQGVSGPDGDDIPGGVKLRLWFCHRPHTDTALPAALAYPGFGRIIDAIAQGSVVPEGKDYMAAYRLVHFASKIYETEDLRVRAVNDVLEEYLKRRIFPNRIPAGE